jgi:hypothetical protein
MRTQPPLAGAGLVNMVYAAPGSAVIELFGHHHATYAFQQLAVLLGLRYRAWRPATVAPACAAPLSTRCKNLVCGQWCSRASARATHFSIVRCGAGALVQVRACVCA